MKRYRCVSVMAALVLAVTASAARAEVVMDFVPVGNAGNAADTQVMNDGTTGCGSVDHAYAIGKYEVTAGQYTSFLSAVAATDTYGLYNTAMANTSYGSGISRVGSSGSYTYSVNAAFANRPVNFVSWGDAARFSNWLHNGQGDGTTEDGAYYLNGATSSSALMAVTRNADAKYWIPTENEWYKAAYHKNDGVTGNYFDYPTSSDTVPGRDMADVSGNNANYYGEPSPIDSPYYTTKVGEFENSESPYGTFDQGGNLFEWNETAVIFSSRGLRGGYWDMSSDFLLASGRGRSDPTYEDIRVGFRVASVPEPASITLMLCGALAGLLWWKRSR